MEKDHDKNQTMTASPEWVTSLPEPRDPDTCQMVVVAATGMDKTTASISMHERDADGSAIFMHCFGRSNCSPPASS